MMLNNFMKCGAITLTAVSLLELGLESGHAAGAWLLSWQDNGAPCLETPLDAP